MTTKKNILARTAHALARWNHDRKWRGVPEPVYAVVWVSGSDPATWTLHMSPALRESTGALGVAVGVVYSDLGSALLDILRNGEPTRNRPDKDGSWVAVRNVKTGDLFEVLPNIKEQP